MRPAVAAQRASRRTDESIGYPAIEERYGQRIAVCLGPAVVTKKWQNPDLVWPHSDLDLRVILDGPPADWINLNRQLAEVQRELVASQPVLRRVLEHPPGWVFLRREADAGLVPAAAVATWSHSFGDPAAVDRWRRGALARPWSVEDERFYRGVIAGRADDAYRLEADSADNVMLDAEHYAAHCVCWHFLAPVVFATESLHACRRLAGKTDAMKAHPVPAVAEFHVMARDGYRGAPAAATLMAKACTALDALPPLPEPTTAPTRPPTLAETVSAVGLLRCRIARYLYYLAPPAGVVTGYLIERETKDLHGAVRVLRAAARAALSPRLGALAERFLQLVPPPPTTPRSLQRFLDNAASDARVVHDLFSTDFTQER